MHFVTGGAFNGKRAWVKQTYKGYHWISAYENASLPIDVSTIEGNLLVLEGIELWVKEFTNKYNLNECRNVWNRCLDQWQSWEKEKPGRIIVIIGTDITKGIVPVEKENRRWRDAAGWAFQDLAARAEKVDIIWYGINHTIKAGGEEE
ncbi:bifunctional adenosylcobinamide kinase/adenosylcobinamide-phosphate guanylyltransferase [Neobacillus mesonae]|uniref:bifunctional adenosylcobinamide kinase/adenosylcobinamide-phosphate guanylyltransferase n=1 Tax=Neobacillus mesonae TaxID=1193713 RepID=UPI00203DCFFD|nr:bifunctional adenosylcobinamide kinase/adenosylcobinamide-phosphate guanylyltransferase [Neobacillus mesonae]MCM3566961.1 bifunctional adenosylcobinamide kinase/adenosylcobinamide-phosphate guanylyltransferase [Neobacillus mesonae]